MTNVTLDTDKRVETKAAVAPVTQTPHKRSTHRGDSFGAGAPARFATGENPADEPLAGVDQSGSDEETAFFDPTQFMLEILDKELKMTEELVTTMSKVISDGITTTLSLATAIGDAQKKFYNNQASMNRIQGAIGITQGVLQLGAAAGQGVGAVYFNRKANKLMQENEAPLQGTNRVAEVEDVTPPREDAGMEGDSIELEASTEEPSSSGTTKAEDKREDKRLERQSKNRDARIGQVQSNSQQLNQVLYGISSMAQGLGQGISSVATVDNQTAMGQAKYDESLAEGQKQATQALYGMLDGAVNKILSRFDQLASMTVETAGTFRAALTA